MCQLVKTLIFGKNLSVLRPLPLAKANSTQWWNFGSKWEKETKKREGTFPATLSARSRTEPHSSFCANKKLIIHTSSYGEQRRTNPWVTKNVLITSEGGSGWTRRLLRDSRIFQELPPAFGGDGRVYGVDGLLGLASSQESAAGCENLSDLLLVPGDCPVFWFKIRFWLKETRKSTKKML